MALNPRSYGLAQIQYLVASINRKNYKGNTSEITTVRHGWVGINKRSWYLLSIGNGVFNAHTFDELLYPHTVHWVIFEVLNFRVLPNIKLLWKIILANDPHGHV